MMDQPTVKLDYLVEGKRPKRRRSLWTFLSLVCIPLIIVDVVLWIMGSLVHAFGDGPPNPAHDTPLSLYALIGLGFIFAVAGLIQTLRHREKYALVDAIIAIVLSGFTLLLPLIDLIRLM